VVDYVQKKLEMFVSRKDDEENKIEETVGVEEQNEVEVGKFSRKPFPFKLLPNEYFSQEAIHWSRIEPGRKYMQAPSPRELRSVK
jgi:hypothetical protein